MKQKMMASGSVSILAVDLSYRSTGIAIANCEEHSTSIVHYECLKNPELGKMIAANYERASRNMINICKEIHSAAEGVDLVVIEMPAFCQSAKASLIIGIMWASITHLLKALPDYVLIEPSALKDWSNSQPGDGKSIVKSKVLSRVAVEKKHKNNTDLIDAIGIALLVSDEIKHDRTQFEFKL